MTLYFSAVWTQSGESGNTLKIKCSVTADERANIFPCLQRPKPSAVAKVRWATLCLTLTKQAFRKDDSVERKPTILAHSTATLTGDKGKIKAPEVSPRRCVRDRPRQQTRNSFERTLSVETSGSINDSTAAEPQRPKSDLVYNLSASQNELKPRCYLQINRVTTLQ